MGVLTTAVVTVRYSTMAVYKNVRKSMRSAAHGPKPDNHRLLIDTAASLRSTRTWWLCKMLPGTCTIYPIYIREPHVISQVPAASSTNRRFIATTPLLYHLQRAWMGELHGPRWHGIPCQRSQGRHGVA